MIIPIEPVELALVAEPWQRAAAICSLARFNLMGGPTDGKQQCSATAALLGGKGPFEHCPSQVLQTDNNSRHRLGRYLPAGVVSARPSFCTHGPADGCCQSYSPDGRKGATGMAPLLVTEMPSWHPSVMTCGGPSYDCREHRGGAPATNPESIKRSLTNRSPTAQDCSTATKRSSPATGLAPQAASSSLPGPIAWRSAWRIFWRFSW